MEHKCIVFNSIIRQHTLVLVSMYIHIQLSTYSILYVLIQPNFFCSLSPVRAYVYVCVCVRYMSEFESDREITLIKIAPRIPRQLTYTCTGSN